MLGYDWPRLHALLNDLPSALLIAAVVFDLLGTFGRWPTMRQASFWTLVFGAIGGVLAVVSGLQAEKHIAHGNAVHEVMEHHEQLALITLGIFGVLALWRIVRESKMGNGERTLALLLSLAGAGVLFATGREGGELMFDHAAGIPSDVLQNELRQRAAGHHHGAGEDTEDHDAGEHDDADAHHDADAGHAHEAAPTGDSAQ